MKAILTKELKLYFARPGELHHRDIIMRVFGIDTDMACDVGALGILIDKTGEITDETDRPALYIDRMDCPPATIKQLKFLKDYCIEHRLELWYFIPGKMKKIDLSENTMKKSTLKKLIESVIKENDDYKHLYGPFANSDDDDDYDWPEDDTDAPNTMDAVHRYVFLADTNDKIVKRYDNTIPNKLIKKLRFKGQRVFDGDTATWGPIHVDALENNDGEVYAYLLYTNDEDAARAITVGKVHPTEIIGDIDENVGYAHGNIGGPPEATTHDPLDKTDIVNEYGDPKTRKLAVRSQGQDKALEMIYQWVKTGKIDHSEFVDLINIFIYSDHDPDDEPKQPSSGLRGEP